MDVNDADLIAEVLAGNTARYELLVAKYQARIFASARRYARSETEVQDLVQDIFIKAFQRLATFRGDAPFEHWLMRLAVRTCYDFLRDRKRNRETTFTDITPEDVDLLDRFIAAPGRDSDAASAARELVHAAMSRLSAPARLVLTLLEIEERSVKEISKLTGWSVALVKVRAFRARAELRKCLERMNREKYL